MVSHNQKANLILAKEVGTQAGYQEKCRGRKITLNSFMYMDLVERYED